VVGVTGPTATGAAVAATAGADSEGGGNVATVLGCAAHPTTVTIPIAAK
jgi:hypothetical protein